MRVNEDADMESRGVYIIINYESGTVYIGATSKSFGDRLRSHLYHLRKNCHSNSHLQHAWNKYRAFAFGFTVLEYIDDASLLSAREKYWIDYHRMLTDIYNIELDPNKFGGHSFRVYSKRSEESIQKQRESLRRYWKTPDGRKRSERLRAKGQGWIWNHVGKRHPLWEYKFSLGDINRNDVSYWEAVEIEYQRWMEGDLTY